MRALSGSVAFALTITFAAIGCRVTVRDQDDDYRYRRAEPVQENRYDPPPPPAYSPPPPPPPYYPPPPPPVRDPTPPPIHDPMPPPPPPPYEAPPPPPPPRHPRGDGHVYECPQCGATSSVPGKCPQCDIPMKRQG